MTAARDQQPPEYRVRKSQREEFLRKTAETLKPYHFITMEREEGDDLLITVMAASSQPSEQAVVQERVQQLASELHIGTYQAGQAAAEEDF